MNTQNFRNFGLNSNTVLRTMLFSDDTKENQDAFYYVTSFTLPSIDLEGQEIRTGIGKLTLPGEVALFNSVTITLLMDEKFDLYKKLFTLLNKYNRVGTNVGCGRIAESWIELYDSKNNYICRLLFHNSKLDQIGEINYSNTDNQVNTINIVLKFDYMEIQ